MVFTSQKGCHTDYSQQKECVFLIIQTLARDDPSASIYGATVLVLSQPIYGDRVFVAYSNASFEFDALAFHIKHASCIHIHSFSSIYTLYFTVNIKSLASSIYMHWLMDIGYCIHCFPSIKPPRTFIFGLSRGKMMMMMIQGTYSHSLKCVPIYKMRFLSLHFALLVSVRLSAFKLNHTTKMNTFKRYSFHFVSLNRSLFCTALSAVRFTDDVFILYFVSSVWLASSQVNWTVYILRLIHHSHWTKSNPSWANWEIYTFAFYAWKMLFFLMEWI